MALSAFVACAVIALILGISEVLWRKKKLKGEAARKFIHILAGSFIAFLPFWMNYGFIVVLALGFIVVNGLNHYFHFFNAVYNVRRKSWGDILFALAILICALVAPDKWIFAAAILHVSLADGMAAMVGTSLGHYHGVYYKVLNHQKTVIGSAAFALLSFLILAAAVLFGTGFQANVTTLIVLFTLPFLTTITEGIGVYGLDNLLLPILVMTALMSLQG